MKKLITSFVLVTGILGIFACCEIEEFFYEINDANVQILQPGPTRIPNDTILTDTLNLRIDLVRTLLAYQPTNTLFVNSALAHYDCLEDPYLVLEDQLTSLNITTLHPFNQFEANDNIAEIVGFPHRRRYDDVQRLMQSLNSSYWFGIDLDEFGTFFLLTIFEKPTNQTQHQFRIQFNFESGRVLEAETGEITWL